VPWQHWNDVGLTRKAVRGRHFGRVFNEATRRAKTIHFNLDDIDDPIEAALKGRGGFGIDNFTNAELSIIRNNKDLLAKTVFYRNGVSVASPF
jgi:hypothetical protein